MSKWDLAFYLWLAITGPASAIAAAQQNKKTLLSRVALVVACAGFGLLAALIPVLFVMLIIAELRSGAEGYETLFVAAVVLIFGTFVAAIGAKCAGVVGHDADDIGAAHNFLSRFRSRFSRMYRRI